MISDLAETSEDPLEWWWCSFGYLRSATILLKEVATGAPVNASARRLVAPACYCLRHGLELLLKVIPVGFGTKVRRSHDQVTLARSALPVRLSDAQAGLLADLSGLDRGELQVAMPAHFESKLGALIAKYDALDPEGKGDPSNTFLRYPTRRADRWIHNLDMTAIEVLRADADEALRLAWMFLGTYSNLLEER
jgi:hypothetical protein